MENFLKDNMQYGVDDAISNKEIEVYFQTKSEHFGIKSREVESLVRWRHQGIAIEHENFYPLINKNEHCLAIGKLMIKESISTLHYWSRIETLNKIRISIKIFPIQLTSQYFLNYLQNLLHEKQIDTQKLQLELVENKRCISSENIDNAIRKIEAFGITVKKGTLG